MTGGIAAILGPVGLNFGSGMTGGLAYVCVAKWKMFSIANLFWRTNSKKREESCLRALIEAHHQRTGSPHASRFLARRSLRNFVRIQPIHLQESLEGVWRAFFGRRARPGQRPHAGGAVCPGIISFAVTPNVFALIIFSCRIRYIHLQRVGDMDFDQLTTFVQVAKLKSFSKAGQKVFRSQSAVSAQIRQLEQSYKAKLLDRSAKSVELTPAGVVLFDYAERLLRLRDESMQIVADRGSVVQGPVTFGANEATCLYLLPDILSEFKRRYPLVHIKHLSQFQPQNLAAS